MHTSGHSMVPALYPGDLIEIKPIQGPIQRGGIYLYQADNRLIIHRVIDWLSEPQLAWLIKGDNNDFPDAPVFPEQILGEVKLIKRTIRHRMRKTWFRLSNSTPKKKDGFRRAD